METTIELPRYPGGRYKSSGPANGEEFRDNILIPLLEKHDVVRIKLDSAAGLPPSFLEEVFGGLVRKKGYSAFQKLDFVTLNRMHAVDLINQFVKEAIG